MTTPSADLEGHVLENSIGPIPSFNKDKTNKQTNDLIYCRLSPKKVFLRHFTRDFARLLQGENANQPVDNFVRVRRNTQQVVPTIQE